MVRCGLPDEPFVDAVAVANPVRQPHVRIPFKECQHPPQDRGRADAVRVIVADNADFRTGADFLIEEHCGRIHIVQQHRIVKVP